MDGLTHTIIAVGARAATYLWGRYSEKQSIEETAETIIKLLEEDGYVKTTTDKKGEKILVRVK